jgi:thiamine transport system substrate-binding protein
MGRKTPADRHAPLGRIIVKTIRLIPVLILMLSLSCCGGGSKEPAVVTVMTHDSFSIGENVVAEFEKANGVKLKFLKSGDAGAALNQAILSKDNPLADVFFGVDNTFLTRALKADIFLPHDSPLLSKIDPALVLDPEKRLLPVDYGDVCLNYDKAWFAEKGLAPPADLETLAKPDYKDLTVVENPATSSPGLAFLLATVGTFGDPGYLNYWQRLKDNGVLVTNGWEDAYYGHFTAASKGDRPIVVSYASSPPATVHFSEKPLDDAPTAAVVGAGTYFRQIEFVGILKGTKHEDIARKLVDFMLDRTFQEDIPLQMFVFPANRDAKLPEVFVKYAQKAPPTEHIAPDKIAANRDKWIQAWTDTVLR